MRLQWDVPLVLLQFCVKVCHFLSQFHVYKPDILHKDEEMTLKKQNK